MTTLVQNAPVNEQTFTKFLFHNRWNKIILYFAAVAIIIQFAIFKYLYPFANYLHDDSLFYLNAAGENLTINTYPIGYSKFLRLVSVFAKPDWVLVSLQYLLIQCSSLFLLFTIFYFYKAGRVTQTILLCLMVINPLFLHLGNMISSDGLFLALSATWFALLLWIMYNPSNKIIFWHAIVLFATFTVRYNALIYPFITVLAFWLSKLPLRKKLAGLGLCLLLCGWFVGLTLFQYKKLTGYWQFSPFSGWLLASNAIIAYKEIDNADRKPVPAELRALDNMVCNFNKMHLEMTSHWDATGYMWRPDFPLMQYRDNQFKKDTSSTRFKKWASMGPFYSSYGWYIIKKYPVHFLRYYVLPNSLKYFAPPVEFLGSYNLGQPTINNLVVKWFGYTNNQVRTRTNSNKVSILQSYPFIVSIINLILFLMLLSYLLLKGWQYSPSFSKSILLAGFLWIANTGFTIVASPVALRFQAFPVMLDVTFSLLLIEWMVRLIQHLKRQSQRQPDSLAI
jgi:hypothetical protein